MDSIETHTGVETPEEVTDGVLHAQEAEDVPSQAEVVSSEPSDAASAQEDTAHDLDVVASKEEEAVPEPAASTSDAEAVISEQESTPSGPGEMVAARQDVTPEPEEVTPKVDDVEPESKSADSEDKAEAAEEDKAAMGGHPMEDWDYQEPRRGQIRVGVILSIREQEIIVDIGAKRDGIVPSSDLQRLDPEALAELAVGQEVPVYVLRTEDQDGNLLVSLNMARQEKAWLHAKELFESGEVVEDRVVGYNKGGLVVPVDEIRGFVPASQVPGFPHGLSQEDRLQRLSDMVGKKLQVKVIEINRRKRRLILSATAAQRLWRKQQRERLLAELREGEVRTGVVSSLCAFGAFVDLGGADGLVHLSELSWRRVRHPREVLKVGDEVEVFVLRLDHERKRIGLSLKRLQPEPWALVEDKYELGQLVEGVVTNVVDFGAFAEIEAGVEGLIHVSELAEGQVSHPRDVVKKGDLLLLRIIRIDTRRKRLGLSLKRVLESEWAEWAAALAVAEAQAAEEAAAEEAAAEAAAAAVAEAAAAAEAAVAENAAAEAAVAEEAAGTEELEEALESAEVAVEEAEDTEATTTEPEVEETLVVEAAAEAAVAEAAAAEAAVAEAAGTEELEGAVESAEAAVEEAEDTEPEAAEPETPEPVGAEAETTEGVDAKAAAEESATEAVATEAVAAEEVEAEEAEATEATATEPEVEETVVSGITAEEAVVEVVETVEVAVPEVAPAAEAATAEVDSEELLEGEEVEESPGELSAGAGEVEGVDQPPAAEQGESQVEIETVEDPELAIVDA